ncbi:helix-turn-helix domain-containing protein [Sphingopyxis sp. JAI128]|uniref:AlbA family DNA-binding domain-containing protein n=1 Tax=Sphingopyxis sp. JAI128 TaxID=2723066 RepID=UPI0021AA1557|nr:ATP-binding protein [Sphingopyxis sp. JAI128]
MVDRFGGAVDESRDRNGFSLAYRAVARDGSTMSASDPASESPGPDRQSWADAALSAELEAVAAASESVSVEFKVAMPDHGGKLAKEMAAFATSGSGRIFVGIDDDGTIVGLPDARSAEGRLKLRGRIEGLAATVKPVIHPALRFAAIGKGDDLRVVAVIDVPKGEAPIYYSGDIGYLRQMSASRPMTPDEVIERIRAWDKASKPTAESRYLGDLARLLLGIDMMLLDYRALSPRKGLRDLKSEAGHYAEQAHRVAASAPQSHAETEPLLSALADELMTIATARSAIGTPQVDLLAAIDEVDRSVRQMRARWVPPEKFGDAAAEEAKTAVRAAAKQLAWLAARLGERQRGTKLGEAPAEVAERGREILRYASLGVGLGDEERVADLLAQGIALRAFAMRQLYHDGGASQRQLIADIQIASERLQDWIADLV